MLATRPNQLWSWDITKLRGPAKWTFYYLYVILDVFSRCVVGWMIAYRETAELGRKLIDHSCHKQGITTGELTVLADRGSSMTSRSVALLLADFGVMKTHSRPHVSDDNPVLGSPVRNPGNTGRTFPTGSAPSKTPGVCAIPSSPGTTTNITPRLSACSSSAHASYQSTWPSWPGE